MSILLIFGGLISLIVLAGLTYSGKGNPIKGLKKVAANDNVYAGWIKFVGVLALVSVVLAFFSGCTSKGTYLAYTEVYGGLQVVSEDSNPYCEDSSSDLISNGGINQNIWYFQSGADEVAIDAQIAHHHSCADAEDDYSHDIKGGLVAKYRHWWGK